MESRKNSPSSNLSRSALTRNFPLRSSEKLRAGTAASNKRRRAFLFMFLGAVSAVAVHLAVRAWIDANKQYEAECAVVAHIGRTNEVIVCVRGIKQRYNQPRIPGSGFDA